MNEQQTGTVRGVVDSPQYGPQDDLMDEIMGDIVSVSRPDTPASVASAPDTGQSSAVKKVKKNSEANKRKSLGGKCSNDGLPDKDAKVKKFKSQAPVSGKILYLYYSGF